MSTYVKVAMVISFLLVCVGLFLFSQSWLNRPSHNGPYAIAAANFGGPFTLVNQDGKTVTEKDFQGTWRLIYFGFTYCPAICPTELGKMTKVMDELGSMAKDIHPIFVSVDPERDTVKVMKSYIASFHPSFTGLTGSVEQVEGIKKSYKVYASKMKDETMTDYTVDHSSFIYLMDPQENLQANYKLHDNADVMIEDIKTRFEHVKTLNLPAQN